MASPCWASGGALARQGPQPRPAATASSASNPHPDDTDEGALADLALSGNGVGGDGPVADITPDAFDFEVPAGGSDSGTLSIGNLGTAELTWSLAEATAVVAREGMPYTYGLAWVPELHAPVGADRASAARTPDAEAAGLRAGRRVDARVLAAPQPAAVGSFAEGFDDIAQLPGAGWAMINNSEPAGPTSWFQGNTSIFPSHEGAPDAYIASNYESTDSAGDISNWLLTPEVTIVNGTELCFWTRTTEQFEEFYDRLEVRMSVEGESTDVGNTAESVGDFITLLHTVNPDLEPNEYPEEWTEICVEVRERSREPVNGRFAFRYWVTDSGANGSNGDYIGIDTVSVTQPGEVPPGGCDSPTDVPWLSADPTSGTTPTGASVPVEVSVDAAGLDEGEHTARLCVSTNDPSAPLVAIPIELTVTGDGGGTEQHDVLLISRAAGPEGVKGNDFSIGTPASDDNRYVAFISAANNLHPDDPDGGVFNEDIYVRDLQTHELILASRASGVDGEKANAGSSFVSLSADGQHIAILSAASNLHPDAPSGGNQAYARDLETHETVVVSRASGIDGAVSNYNSFDMSNSGDGRYVAFECGASNLHPDDTVFKKSKIFVRDLQAHETILVSRADGADGASANGPAQRPAISDDGRYVAFDSRATNIHPDVEEEESRIYVRDLATQETILVDRASGPDGAVSNAQSCCPAISADGRFVVYDSAATNIHPEATDGTNHVYARDLQTHETILVSRASGADGAVGNDRSFVGQTGGGHWISSDGRYVIFLSEATNLHPDDSDDIRDTYVRDLWTHETVLVSRAAGAAGEKGNDRSINAMLSPDGRYALFSSSASNLHPDDTDDIWDIFVRDLLGAPLVGRGGESPPPSPSADRGR